MIALENADEISRILDHFTEQKATEIPPELGAYINHVAKTGDTVYRWSAIQYLFREKIKTVIKEFQDTSTSIKGALKNRIFPRNIFFLFHSVCNIQQQQQHILCAHIRIYSMLLLVEMYVAYMLMASIL